MVVGVNSTVETDGSTQAYRLDSYSVVSEMFLRGDVFMIVISNLQYRGKDCEHKFLQITNK